MSRSLKTGSCLVLLPKTCIATRLPPIFLAPMLEARPEQKSQFSSSSPVWQRKRRDNNPNRGVSALRRTGLRYPVGMSKEPLPEPVLDPAKRSKIAVDENHGLWAFFNPDKKPYGTPKEYSSHGKPSLPPRSYREAYNHTSKDDHGLFKSYETSRGKIYILFGGCAAKNATDWQQRNSN